MKIALILLILSAFIEKPDIPEGIWVYKQDFSRIEIIDLNGKLSGKLISTRNPNNKIGTAILEDFVFVEGKWQGRYFLHSKNRWVEANMVLKGDLLFIELELGYGTKIIHLFKENIKN